jgi:hypothetical protein
MWGQALRLLAVGQVGQRLGGYAKNMATRYLVLSVAGTAFLGATVFAILAGFWALNSSNNNPVLSAGIMAGILVLVGCLIALVAFGITREKQEASVSETIRQPFQSLQNQIPTVDDVGRQIEDAVKQYGPLRVAAAAIASGVVAGLIARRYGESRLFGGSRANGYDKDEEYDRRYARNGRRNGRRYEEDRRYI